MTTAQQLVVAVKSMLVLVEESLQFTQDASATEVNEQVHTRCRGATYLTRPRSSKKGAAGSLYFRLIIIFIYIVFLCAVFIVKYCDMSA